MTGCASPSTTSSSAADRVARAVAPARDEQRGAARRRPARRAAGRRGGRAGRRPGHAGRRGPYTAGSLPAMRIGRQLRSRGAAGRQAARPSRLDSWLEHLSTASAWRPSTPPARTAGAERFALFRDLETDLWALLLTQRVRRLPEHPRAAARRAPIRALQELWNGTSGVALAAQSAAFYKRLRERFAEHTGRGLAEARVLDFGCGWGRLTRFLARDVAPGRLYGCDPAQQILDVCAQARVPRDPRTQRLRARARCPSRSPSTWPSPSRSSPTSPSAAHEALPAGAARGAGGRARSSSSTVRPPAYAAPLAAPDAGRSPVPARGAQPRYLFVPHPAAGAATRSSRAAR